MENEWWWTFKFILHNRNAHCILTYFLNNCSVFPNATAKVKGERKVLVGHEILSAQDVSSLALKRPVDRGYIVAFDIQKEIWSRAFRHFLGSRVSLQGSSIILTEPYMNLPSLRRAILEILFREFGLKNVLMAPSASLALHWHVRSSPAPSQESFRYLANVSGCALVVDAGFSYTHIVPVFDWHIIPKGIRRIDLGGKALTNYMKELVSFRSINLMDEPYLMEHIKDQICFVSQNPRDDLKESKKRNSQHKVEWLLPDGVTSTWGRLRGPEDPPRGPKDPILVVNNERFMVPEALFNPADIGLEEKGLAEAALESVNAVHHHLHALLWSQVIVIGGTGKCPGFVDRLHNELRPLVPDEYELNVSLVSEPELAAWKGAQLVANSPLFSALAVTRSDWQKHGDKACLKWFDN